MEIEGTPTVQTVVQKIVGAYKWWRYNSGIVDHSQRPKWSAEKKQFLAHDILRVFVCVYLLNYTQPRNPALSS